MTTSTETTELPTDNAPNVTAESDANTAAIDSSSSTTTPDKSHITTGNQIANHNTQSSHSSSPTSRNHRLLGPSDPGLTPLIICFHGSGTDPLPSWEILIGILAKKYRVLLYDRGPKISAFTSSSIPARTYLARNQDIEKTVSQEVTALQAYLKQQGLKPRYVLLAHSYGGAFAKSLLSRRPEDVAGVVLVETGQETSGVSEETWRRMTRKKAPIMGNLPLVVIRGNSLIKQWKELEKAEEGLDRKIQDEENIDDDGNEDDVNDGIDDDRLDAKTMTSTLTWESEDTKVDRTSICVNSMKKEIETQSRTDKKVTARQQKREELEKEKAKLNQHRKWLETADAEDEKLKKAQLALSRNTIYIYLADCGHDVIRAKPEIVADEVDHLIERLTFARRGTKEVTSERGGWWKNWVSWLFGG